MEYDVKDMLEIAIDNNDSLWEVAVIDRLQGELDRLYSQEAKAKAFDNLVDVAYWHFERIHPDDDNGLQYESFYDDIRDEFKKLESGEPNELRE